MHPNPRRIAPIFLLVVILGFVWWFFSQQNAQAQNGPLQASGAIEAAQVKVAAEVGGKVIEVLVEQGQAVRAGQALARFDDSLLQAQFQQAQAALALAQANYDLIAAGAPDEQRRAAIAAAEAEVTSAQQALDALNETAALARAQAQQIVAAVDRARDKAQQRRDSLVEDADQADVDAAWAAVVIAEDKLEDALDDFDRFDKKAEDNLPRAIMQAQLAGAQKNYDAVVERYNNVVGKPNQYETALAEADLRLAEEQLADALRQYEEVLSGPDPDAVALAEARLGAAQAALAAAQADPSAEQLAAAQAQVDKLVISAHSDGVVLARAIEPGEYAVPGAPLFTLARLDELTITVFVPEDRFGLIVLGQEAQVRVDSYPDEIFTAGVMRIADQAEFTPRNVQTEEGRRTTVFAIELKIANPDGRLKPGMPADVTFEQ
jgi:multidrug resistance efflux pump